MSVVESQETVDGQLRAEVVVLSAQHLFAHAGSDLGHKVQDCPKTKISSLATLIVLRMLDAPSTSECIHTGIDILVEMESLLRLGDATSGSHVECVEEIGVTIVKLPSEPRQRAGGEGTKCLFLPGGQVSQNTNILGKDVFASSDDSDRRLLEIFVAPVSVRTLARYIILLEFAEDVADLETLLEVVVLVGVDQLKVFTTVKDDSVILIVRFSVSKDRVTRKLDPELWSPFSCLNVELGVAINERGKEPRISSLLLGWFLLEVCNLEFGVCAEQEFGVLMFLLVELRISLHGNDELELAPGHRLQLAFELFGVPSKGLNDLGVFNAIEKFYGFPVIHHTRNSAIESLGAK